MSVMFLPLKLIPVPVQCVVMSTVLDLVFRRDEKLKLLLDAMDGRVFRIHITDTNAVMFLGFSRARGWVHSMHTGSVDVRLSGTTAGFARMCFGHEDPDELVFEQVLKLSGDSDAMLRFKRLFAAADLDWERELRASFGDFFGVRVARAAHALVQAEQRLAIASRETVMNRFHDMEIPDSDHVQQWQAGVEHLSFQVEKMKGRVTRIEQRLGRHQNDREE
ncbi:MAG: SCP2 sterol-binding domain-containing protein [Mariprofundus sp.]|nr:SCP2 sterol-binding domain-containing protein [Mariprofundus sp.]